VTNGAFVMDSGNGPIWGSMSPDRGRNLLLLHGGPGLGDYMNLLGEETSGWRTISYQQRGLLPSTRHGPFDIEQHVADAIMVLDGLDIPRTVVLGHSWGAHLALQIALAAPERVTAVVAVDGLGPTGDGGTGQLAVELRNRLSPTAARECDRIDGLLSGPLATDGDLLESVALLWPSYFANPAAAAPVPLGLRASLAATSATSESLLRQLGDGSFASRLAGLAVPTVVMVGEASPMPPEAGKSTADLLPNATLVTVPGGGHLPWFERPGCVAEVLAGLA
jgi:proline iminopeptidase